MNYLYVFGYKPEPILDQERTFLQPHCVDYGLIAYFTADEQFCANFKSTFNELGS